MNAKQAAACVLNDIKSSLEKLSDEQYKKPLDILSGASIGQHTRHIIEFFQCLHEQYPFGRINYDQRRRNKLIEEHIAHANSAIDEIVGRMEHMPGGAELQLEVNYDLKGKSGMVPTTYEREIVYNIEHAIHHMAMIKIGFKVLLPGQELSENYGVAPSTIKYRRATQKSGA